MGSAEEHDSTSSAMADEDAQPVSKHKRRNEIDRAFSFSIFAVVVAAVLLCDQVTKVLIRNTINPGQHIPFIPHVLDFMLLYNSGAAFGMMAGAQLYFVGIALAFVGVIIIYLAKRRRNSVFDVVALSFVAGGALGNLLDRLFQSGKVTDFMEFLFVNFPIFNLADACVTVGTILFVIAFIVHPQEDIVDKPNGKHDKTAAGRAEQVSEVDGSTADGHAQLDLAAAVEDVSAALPDPGPPVGKDGVAEVELPADAASSDEHHTSTEPYWHNPLHDGAETNRPTRTNGWRGRR